jgi:hypothetical protein
MVVWSQELPPVAAAFVTAASVSFSLSMIVLETMTLIGVCQAEVSLNGLLFRRISRDVGRC